MTARHDGRTPPPCLLSFSLFAVRGGVIFQHQARFTALPSPQQWVVRAVTVFGRTWRGRHLNEVGLTLPCFTPRVRDARQWTSPLIDGGGDSTPATQPRYSDGRRVKAGEHGRWRSVGDVAVDCNQTASVQRAVFAFRTLQP